MKRVTVITALSFLFFIFSCGAEMEKDFYNENMNESASYSVGDSVGEYDDYENEEAQNDKKDKNHMSSSAAVENKKDSIRKFIRTANIKFKVKNVVTSTYAIEDIVTKHDGFVTYTNLSSDVNRVEKTPISADSILETTYFTVINSITLRVPNTKLDTTLKDIAKYVDFLDFRIIQADDIHLSLLANQMKQKRSEENEELLTEKVKSTNSNAHNDYATSKIIESKEQADQAKLAKLQLMDAVNYSTVTLFIYQRESLKREVIPNYENVEAYEPSFGSKVSSSLAIGLKGLEAILLFFITIWPLLIIGIIGYIVYKKYTK
jgi:hypothetical protein